MVGIVAYLVVLATLVVLLAATLRECDRLRHEKSVLVARNATLKARCATLESRMPRNEHARMLDEILQAKEYGSSEWDTVQVVAVSHKGALAVRPVSNPKRSAMWIHRNDVSERVRTSCKSES